MQSSKIFISYSRSDSEFVLRLASNIRDSGAAIWLDSLSIIGGTIWDSEVEKALRACNTFIVILTPDSIKSKNVQDEISYAFDEQKIIIPIMLISCRVPYRLRRLQYIDFTSNYEMDLNNLFRSLQPGPSSNTPFQEEIPPTIQSDNTPKKTIGGKVTYFFEWLNKGKKKYAIIPITVLIIISLFLFYWKDMASTYITQHEMDVMNEWVILVHSYNDKDLAEQDYKNFVEIWKNYDTTWLKDIHLVRSCKDKKAWMLIIDAGEGKQSEESEKNAIRHLDSLYNPTRFSPEQNREIRNNIGQLLDNSSPLYYDQKDFELNNGKIGNVANKDLLKKK